MQDIIDNLPKNSILIDENLLVLQSLAEVNKDLLMRQVVQKRGVPQPVQYSPELRGFALTMHFYSPRAYTYVRQVFHMCLTHPRTLGKWY